MINPATWNYVSLAHYNVTPGVNYQRLVVGNWYATQSPNIVFRVPLLGNGNGMSSAAWADDLKIGCIYATPW